MKFFYSCFLLSILSTVAACNSPTPLVTAQLAASPPPIPGIITVAQPFTADSLTFPKVFGAAFLQGTTVKQDSITYAFRLFGLGNLTSLSGKLVAGDPIVLTSLSAFSQRFPVGSFPVQLALAKLPNDERVGFARILFSSARVAKWELARLPGQKPLALQDSSFYCYGVDGGMGAFIDSVTNRHLARQGQATWDKIFMRKPEQPDYQGYIYSFGGGNLATFLTGFGDGCYATYIGFNAQGQVCQLLTDFGLVVW
jgi:hypothetical protein